MGPSGVALWQHRTNQTHRINWECSHWMRCVTAPHGTIGYISWSIYYIAYYSIIIIIVKLFHNNLNADVDTKAVQLSYAVTKMW